MLVGVRNVSHDSLVKIHSHHLLASRPNEILTNYYTVLDPSGSVVENMLVVTDVFSEYTLAVPVRDQQAEMVAQDLVTKWLGIPGLLHSEPGA